MWGEGQGCEEQGHAPLDLGRGRELRGASRSGWDPSGQPSCSWRQGQPELGTLPVPGVAGRGRRKRGGSSYLSTAKLAGFFLAGYTLPWPLERNRDTQAAWKSSSTNMTGGSSTSRRPPSRLPSRWPLALLLLLPPSREQCGIGGGRERGDRKSVV